MQQSALDIHEVDTTRWADLERLFEGKGGPKYCWCMAWRAMPPDERRAGGQARKAAFQVRVMQRTPVGLLGYRGGEPVAWCSIAPRTTYRQLGGPSDFGEDSNAVWSIACFFIRRDCRGQGLCDPLLKAAIDHARGKGAKILEAYPVDPDSPSYRFMGFVGLFQKFGFDAIGRAGSRRHVMRLSLA